MPATLLTRRLPYPGNDQQADGFDVDDIWIENEDEDIFNQLVKQRNSEALHEAMKALPEEQSFHSQEGLSGR